LIGDIFTLKATCIARTIEFYILPPKLFKDNCRGSFLLSTTPPTDSILSDEKALFYISTGLVQPPVQIVVRFALTIQPCSLGYGAGKSAVSQTRAVVRRATRHSRHRVGRRSARAVRLAGFVASAVTERSNS